MTKIESCPPKRSEAELVCRRSSLPSVSVSSCGVSRQALKVTPGNMVYEIQPNVEWDKGRAVLYLLDLGGSDVMPLYVGDDITDANGFEALAGRGIGSFVGNAGDEPAGRRTAAEYVLASSHEVERFLETLAR